MKTPESLGWGDDANLIICHLWDLPFGAERHPLAVRMHCELCGVAISAFPVSVERARNDKSFHLICTPYCFGKLMEESHIVPKGRITDNTFVHERVN